MKTLIKNLIEDNIDDIREQIAQKMFDNSKNISDDLFTIMDKSLSDDTVLHSMFIDNQEELNSIGLTLDKYVEKQLIRNLINDNKEDIREQIAQKMFDNSKNIEDELFTIMDNALENDSVLYSIFLDENEYWKSIGINLDKYKEKQLNKENIKNIYIQNIGGDYYSCVLKIEEDGKKYDKNITVSDELDDTLMLLVETLSKIDGFNPDIIKNKDFFTIENFNENGYIKQDALKKIFSNEIEEKITNSYQGINNMKFAGNLKGFISNLFSGIDIEKTKDDSKVEIINNGVVTYIGNKSEKEKKPFIRGVLIAFGQYIRNDIKNYLNEKLELNDQEKLKGEELQKIVRLFNQNNHPQKLFNSEEMLNHFTGVDTPFTKKTILKIHISETGEIKEFTGKELFKKLDKLLFEFIEKNIEVIMYSEDIWTNMALTTKKENHVNIISDARFVTELKIALKSQEDSFVTLILPISKDGDLNIQNFDEIYNLYKKSTNIEDFISLVSKPAIFNKDLVSGEELEDFKDRNHLEGKEKVSVKDRERFYKSYIAPLLEDEELKKQIPQNFTRKLINEAEELSSLLVLTEYLKKNKPEMLNSKMEESLKKEGFDNPLVIESKRGDFKGLIESVSGIKDKIDQSKSHLTLLSTISGGGKDTLTDIFENVVIKKLPHNKELINETFQILLEKLNSKNIKEVVTSENLKSQEDILKKIIKDLPSEHIENANFLNKVSTLNISFTNDIGKVLKEIKHKELSIKGLEK